MVTRVSPQCQALIEYQRGVLARWQVESPADVTAIDSLLRTDRWRGLYRGVYLACTGMPSWEGVLWAALRRCGPDAGLSHATAAELDGIASRQPRAVHVTVPAHQRVSVARGELDGGLPRIVVHRSARLPFAIHPARTPPRTRAEETVLDLAESARSIDVVFSVLSAACAKGVVTPGQVRAAVERRKKMRWRGDILVALNEITDGVLSMLERRYLRNVERPHGLPKPKRQLRMRRNRGSAYLDLFFDGYDLAVELDGRAAHPVEERWRDIHRDNFFASAGIITLRYNWADITTRPCQVAAEITAILRLRGWSGTVRSCGPRCEARSA
jgi:very-short-patch-repair endonuclease